MRGYNAWSFNNKLLVQSSHRQIQTRSQNNRIIERISSTSIKDKKKEQTKNKRILHGISQMIYV